jgi:Tol biopolymer transport system component
VWSPDARDVAFSSSLQGSGIHLYHKALQGDAPASPLGQDLVGVFPESFPRTVKGLLYVTLGSPEGQSFGFLSLEGEARSEAILTRRSAIDEPEVSPDGRWLSYGSQESGQWEVYVQPFRAKGEAVRVSTEGGGQARWRGDGRELFYVAPDGRLMAVEVRATSGRIEIGLPKPLFGGVNPDPTTDHYAVTADGQRFLLPMPVGENPGARIHVVTNWSALLK